MALIEKERQITETYLALVCDLCGAEAVTTYVDEQALCDECVGKQAKQKAAPADAEQE